MYKVPVNYHTKFRFVTAIYMSTYAHTQVQLQTRTFMHSNNVVTTENAEIEQKFVTSLGPGTLVTTNFQNHHK